MENELTHYGVKGMKWGVRRNPSRAYRKASTKANKLREKSDEAYTASRKAEMKAAKATSKYTKAKYKSDIDSWGSPSARKLNKLADISAKATYDAAVKKYEAYTTSKRFRDWHSKMAEVFSGIGVSQIDPLDLQSGRDYVRMLVQDQVDQEEKY